MLSVKKIFRATAVLLSLLGLTHCSSKSTKQSEAPSRVIESDVMGADGILGTVKMSPEGDGVKVSLMVRNLPRGKVLATHIHEKPTCTPPNFKSAGGHYNPKNKKHGSPQGKEHHLGDLGNFEVSDKGVLKSEKVFKFLSLDPESKNFIGNRALIIHEGQDQFTQPTGDAGGRLACAIL